MEKGKITLTQKDAENTPAGGVVVGKRDGQTMIYDDASLGGYFVGKLHKDGGIKMINKSTGQPLEVQGAEVIITAPAVADTTKREFEGKMMTNREILSKINSDGGGVSFADGGDIPAKIHTTDKEYEFGGKMVHDTDIAHSLGMNSTLKKGKQQFSSGNLTYDVDAIYNAIKKGKLRLKTKEVETFPMKYPVYDKKYSETVKTDFRKPNGITVSTESGEEVLIDGNHRMNNAYLNGRKTMKTYYIEDPKQIAKFTKKNKFELGGENKVGGHLSKGKSLKQIAEMHNVSLAHINEELAKGLEVEKEHFADFKERTRVAKDHLVENPNYYTILEKAGLKNGGGVDNDEKNVLKVEVTLYNLGINKEIAHNLEELHSIFKKFYTKVENILSYDDILIFVTPIGKNDKLFKETSIRIGNGIKEINPFTVSKEKLGKTLKGNYGGLDWSYFFNKSKKYSEGGSVNLVEESKKGDHTARDLNNYNDIMDLQADGSVGGDDGLSFADGGEISDLKIGDVFKIDSKSKYGGLLLYVPSEDNIYHFDNGTELKLIRLDSAGDENYKSFSLEQLGEKVIVSIGNTSLQKMINEKSLEKVSFADGGITPYDANLEGDSVNIIENGFAGGGVVYDSKNPKIEKVTIKDTKFNRTSVIGRNASTVSELQQIVSDYIGVSPKEDYDWINFYVNDNTRGSYYIDLNKGKKNTVKNVNPETLNSVNFKRVIDANKYLVKNYDWSEFFELGSNVSKTTSTLKAQSKDPEYYEFIGNNKDFTKGKIYKIKNPSNLGDSANFIDDKGVGNGWSSNNYKYFKPSTEEAFLVQQSGVSPVSSIEPKSVDAVNVEFVYPNGRIEVSATINVSNLKNALANFWNMVDKKSWEVRITPFENQFTPFEEKKLIIGNDFAEFNPETFSEEQLGNKLKSIYPDLDWSYFLREKTSALNEMIVVKDVSLMPNVNGGVTEDYFNVYDLYSAMVNEQNSGTQEVFVTVNDGSSLNTLQVFSEIVNIEKGSKPYGKLLGSINNDDFKNFLTKNWFPNKNLDWSEFFEESQTTTVSSSLGSVKKIADLKEAIGVLEGFASKASKKYNTKNYDEALQLLNEVKEEYSLALSFTPESSFMYERIELIKKINEIQKEITKITDLKSGGAYYILSKVIDKLERGEDWKESGRGEILTNDVPKQEIDSVIFTDRFKNWFGDWEKALVAKEYDYVSKALNENGMPSIMYHGAKRIKYSYRQVSNGVLYLAENRSYAEWFSANESPYQKQGDYLTQCFVNIKNPIDLTSLGVEELDLRDVIQFIDTLYPLAKIYDVLPPNTAMAIMNNQLIGRKFRAWNIIRSFPELNSHVRDNTNYDGFIYYENNPSDIVINEVSGIMEENITKATAVFNSNQVKLVDAVLFDSSLDDWRFEIGGKVN